MASRAQTPLWRETMRAGAARSGALIGAIAIMIGAVLMLIALATYHSGDPSLNTASGGPAENWLGEPGAWIADICFLLFGPAILLVLPISLMIALRLWRDIPVGRWRLMLATSIIGIALIGTTFAPLSSSVTRGFPAGAGGIIGIALADLLHWAISQIGDPTAMLWTARGVGLLTGLAGMGIGAWSFVIDMGDRRQRPQPAKSKSKP